MGPPPSLDPFPAAAPAPVTAIRSPAAAAVRPLAWRLVAVAAAMAAMLGGHDAIAQRDVANPALPKVALTAGIHRIQAEVADTPPKRQRGLMGRESLGPNEGMLFVFEDRAVHCFWMKNTPLPLSIAFVGEDGVIVNIADMQPFSEATHCPDAPIRHALEMEQGWFARKGIAAGSRIGGLTDKAPSPAR